MIVARNRKTRSIAMVLLLLFIATFFYLRTFKGEMHELPQSLSHYLTLWVSAVLMWTFALYSLYLALDGAASGKFPAARARLPVDCRQYVGVYANLSRLLMFAAALGFIAFPGFLLLHVHGVV